MTQAAINSSAPKRSVAKNSGKVHRNRRRDSGQRSTLNSPNQRQGSVPFSRQMERFSSHIKTLLFKRDAFEFELIVFQSKERLPN